MLIRDTCLPDRFFRSPRRGRRSITKTSKFSVEDCQILLTYYSNHQPPWSKSRSDQIHREWFTWTSEAGDQTGSNFESVEFTQATTNSDRYSNVWKAVFHVRFAIAAFPQRRYKIVRYTDRHFTNRLNHGKSYYSNLLKEACLIIPNLSSSKYFTSHFSSGFSQTIAEFLMGALKGVFTLTIGTGENIEFLLVVASKTFFNV